MDILRGNKRFYTFLVFLGFFILACILNWDARYEKPVWDTAAGVFAPAIYLYEAGFDFYSLLEEPGFNQDICIWRSEEVYVSSSPSQIGLSRIIFGQRLLQLQPVWSSHQDYQ